MQNDYRHSLPNHCPFLLARVSQKSIAAEYRVDFLLDQSAISREMMNHIARKSHMRVDAAPLYKGT